MSAPPVFPSSRRRLTMLAGCLLVSVLAVVVPGASAATTPMVDLAAASTYAALSGASVGNTVNAPGAPHTTLRGDLGVKAATEPTGFPPGVFTGTKNVGNVAASQAHAALVAAYAEVAARPGGEALAGALVGTTIAPGLHTIAGAASNTGTVTLDAGGDPNAVFVFQVGGALAFAAGSHVVLAGGARASRVFWQVNGAGALGANADFAGTLMALDAVGVGNSSVVNGRVFARNGALTLDANEVYSQPPVVTITGGAQATTTDTTPTIAGTTDVEAPALVTVTVNGQTLTATPSAGTWSVTSAILANATYPVVASVTDGAGNPASATQQLTVDTIPPVVTIDGGATAATNDPTPTISGHSDVAPGSVVHVGVAAQTLTALVQSGGTWNVTPSTLVDGTHAVTAAVTDPAGNPGNAGQALTVDTTAPGVTIAGGADALTDDATPTISGTAAVSPGTTVTVDLADETLTGAVQGDGSWSVTASALADGPHRVVMHVSDGAGNPASLTQRLTVDTVAPAVTITGGGAATSTDLDPTITGTSDAAPGTTVTVFVAGQTMTTLVQANGSWNATPGLVGEGTWGVLAAVVDPAGNVGRAGQLLTISRATAPGDGPPSSDPPSADPPPAGPPPPGGVSVNAVATTRVARSTSQRLRGSSLVIPTKVTAPAAGRVVATASGRVTIRGVKRAIPLTKVTAKIAAGHHATLSLKPKGSRSTVRSAFRKISTAVRKGHRVTAAITVRIVDAAGHTRTVKRTVRLIRR